MCEIIKIAEHFDKRAQEIAKGLLDKDIHVYSQNICDIIDSRYSHCSIKYRTKLLSYVWTAYLRAKNSTKWGVKTNAQS